MLMSAFEKPDRLRKRQKRRRLLPVFSYIAEQTGKSWKKTKQLDCFRIKGAESCQLISQFERCP
ncbi:hypothetical protein SXCC_01931 [Gluconacetobacter sp. SXCC-1]|nr:hypothetical protein SXCC_01931 [Gluconacetobacter sp. SXCC-1]